MAELSSRLHTWAASGKQGRFDQVTLWYRTFGKRNDSLPWLVCFHGFPTSSWDWHRLVPLIRDQFRVLVFDFPGYGLSEKSTSRDYSILRQLDAALALLRHLQISEYHLLAHDMGDTVACELMHRMQAGEVKDGPLSVTLLNGGLYPELHQPLPTQRALRTPVIGALTARFASWRLFRHQYPRVYADPDSFSLEHYREQWALMLHNGGRNVLHRVAGYMPERIRRRERWLGALHRHEGPLQLIWGDQDPIAVSDMPRRLLQDRQGVDLHMLEGIGHYPQLENPQSVFEHLRSFVFH